MRNLEVFLTVNFFVIKFEKLFLSCLKEQPIIENGISRYRPLSKWYCVVKSLDFEYILSWYAQLVIYNYNLYCKHWSWNFFPLM